MNLSRSLNTLSAGEKAFIKAVNVRGAMKRRLSDLGLIPGTEVACLLKSPSGDPVAYRIRGAVIALRTEDTSEILLCS